MKPKLRIAYGRIMQETNALSVVPTTLEDFRRTHLVRGSALAPHCKPLSMEVPGLYRNVELSGFVRAANAFKDAEVELVPLLSAWAISGGPLTRETYDALEEMLLEELRDAGPVDGVFLAQHGAMGVIGLSDPEAALVQAIKRTAPGVMVACSFDLHGNLTQERVDCIDVISGYHTNPHRDHARTARRAGTLLLRALLGQVKIKTAWRSLPMLLGGGNTVDFLQPMRPLFAKAKAMATLPGVLDVSIFPVHLWIDHPEVGWSVLVHTDGDQALAERLADELAEACWAVRHEMPPEFPDAHEAVRQAHEAKLARKLGAVLIADASDVVTAGSIGESTELLRVLASEGQGLVSYVPIRDAEVVAAFADEPLGTEKTLDIGGKLDPARTTPVRLTVKLHHKPAKGPFGRVVVLDCGTTRLVVTEEAPMFIKPSLLSDVGLDPWRADVIVVKNFFPFRMFYLPLARKTIYVKTGGITDFDAAYGLEFAGPVHPRDEVRDWRETDRRRRSVQSTNV